MTKLEKEAENLAIKEARNYKTVYSEDFRFDEVMKDPLRFDEDYPKTLYLLMKEKHYRDGFSDGYITGYKKGLVEGRKEKMLAYAKNHGKLTKEKIELIEALKDKDRQLNNWYLSYNEVLKENAELKIKLNGALDICNIPEFRINDLENVIEEAIKVHCLFRQNEVINFTSKCVWEALNPDTKMCIPNAMFIKIEELLKDYIEKELVK